MQLTFVRSTARGLIWGWVALLVACGASNDADDTAATAGSGGTASVSNGGTSGTSNGSAGSSPISSGGSAGNSGTSAGNGNTTNGGSSNAGSTNGGSSNGGATNGGSTNGGSSNGGSTNGGSSNGGSTNGGSSNGGTGAGGSAGSAGSGGNVPLPPSVTALFPAPGASGVCLDAPLTISFASTPSIGTSGKISIFAKSDPNTPVDTVDVSSGNYTDTIGGQKRNLVRPIFIDGKSAVIYFHQRKLSADTSYFVTVSSGAFVDSSKAAMGTVTSNSAWSFTTGGAPTVGTAIRVNRTGSGGFCTVQGAFDAIPANNTTARTITVEANTYHEILYLSGKKNLTLTGSDRANTIIAYPNNDKLNAGTSARPLFYANGANGLTVSNLTIFNTTPQGGSQAEAFAVNADQVILRDANVKSLQDTLLFTGRVYVTNSYVEGNVDFVWGSGVAYFDSSEIKTVGRAGAIVQARNGANGYGYVFVDSKLTSDPGVTGQVLARIDATVYPYSHVAYINCQMSSAIVAKGWTITPAGTTATSHLRFWEYQSTDASGKALNVSGRDPASKQIDSNTAAMMRDKATVLGGWNPQ